MRPLPAMIAGTLLALLATPLLPATWDDGLAAFKAGRYQEAVRAFGEVASHSPDAPQGHYMLGLALLQARRAGDALEPLATALGLAEQNVDYRLALSRAQLQANQPDAALATVATQDPGLVPKANREAYTRLLARAAGLTGDTAAAAPALDRALAVDESKHLWVSRAKVAGKLGRPAEVFAAKAKAFELAKAKAFELDVADEALGRSASKAAIAIAKTEKGESRTGWYRKAAAVASELARAVPKADSWLLAGEASMGAKEYGEAIEWFEKVTAAEPKNPLAHYYLGRSSQGLEDHNAALSHLKKAFERSPDAVLRPLIQVARGQALRHLEKFEQAAVAYRQAGDAEMAAKMDRFKKAKADTEEWERAKARCEQKKIEITDLLEEFEELKGSRAWDEMMRDVNTVLAACEPYFAEPEAIRSERIESDEGASKPQRGFMTKPRVSAQRVTLGIGTPTSLNPEGV